LSPCQPTATKTISLLYNPAWSYFIRNFAKNGMVLNPHKSHAICFITSKNMRSLSAVKSIDVARSSVSL